MFHNLMKSYFSTFFLFSLILMQLSFAIYYFLKINIPFQHFITFNILILFPLYIILKRIKFVVYDIPIFCSLIYFLIMLPISCNFSIGETIKSFKDTIMPLVIYFFCRAKIQILQVQLLQRIKKSF